MIRNMGLLGQILFVLNADLSEHEDLAGLEDLKQRVKEEIALVRPDPELFCFSPCTICLRRVGIPWPQPT